MVASTARHAAAGGCLYLEKAEPLRRHRLDGELADRLAAQAKALSDPTRLTIAAALAAPTSCACLIWPGQPNAPRTSSAITSVRFRAIGLAASRRDGKMVLYRLTDTGRRPVDAHLAAVQAPI